MGENLTEANLSIKDREYREKYNYELDRFGSMQYSFEQHDMKRDPVRYIRIVSIERSADMNPALIIREQMQKALMALWTVDMRFNMMIDHRGSIVSFYVGTECAGGNFSTLFALKNIFSGSMSGIMFESDTQTTENNVPVYTFDRFYSHYQNSRIGFFVGDPIVGDLSADGKSVSAIDEIISGSEGRDWILCISALPISKDITTDERAALYSELAECSRFTGVSFGYNVVGNNRSMNVQERFSGTQMYSEFIEKKCAEYDEAMKCGQWSVGAFCAAADDFSRDIFGGMFSAHMKSGFEQLERPFPFDYRVSDYLRFNEALQIPHSASCMSLSTRELSVISALPVRDTCGFNVAERIEFDAYREDSGDLRIGRIANGRNITNADYRIDLDTLNRHGLIIGLTGGGKTNTVKTLLHSFYRLNCPFMVIEPAKKEYYEIYNMGITDLRIYSVGSTSGVQLYINPFEVAGARENRVSLQSHIDAVFAAFKASFIMYTPMPYVLENAIYAIYRDYGWDPETDKNRYDRNDYPTIEDLYYKIDPIVREMGYDQKMQNDLIGSMKSRINSLRVGSKGQTLNVARSVDMEELLGGNTIIELDDLNDEDAKAFIISLLLLRIQECRKVQPTSQLKVKHILLIEEAHRLLKNVSSGTGENADPRGNAVEFFCNMLAEMRSKGQGFLVIDQSPSKLAPDLIKNTNLKIIHRTVSGDDRHLVGSAMNMTEAQEEYLSCLKQGFAAVYSEGDNRPKLVKLPYAGEYEKYSLDRDGILSAIVKNYRGINEDAEDILPQDRIDPICRHCRKCSRRSDPELRFRGDPKTLAEIRSTYSLQAHVALKRFNGIFPNNGELKNCAIAAWFKANESGRKDHRNYSRVLDFFVKRLFH